jgi:hypothetical protein
MTARKMSHKRSRSWPTLKSQVMACFLKHSLIATINRCFFSQLLPHRRGHAFKNIRRWFRNPSTLRMRRSELLYCFTSKVTVLSPPAFLMTNLYFPSFAGASFTEHFGPGESSLPTSLPDSS